MAKDPKKLALKTRMICLKWAIDEKSLELMGDAGIDGCIASAFWTDANLSGVKLMP